MTVFENTFFLDEQDFENQRTLEIRYSSKLPRCIAKFTNLEELTISCRDFTKLDKVTEQLKSLKRLTRIFLNLTNNDCWASIYLATAGGVPVRQGAGAILLSCIMSPILIA